MAAYMNPKLISRDPPLSVVGGNAVKPRPRTTRPGTALYGDHVHNDRSAESDDIAALLSRLQSTNLRGDQQPKSTKHLMNIKCSCGDLSNLTLKLEDISESDSDSDQCEFSFSQLLSTLIAYNKKDFKKLSVPVKNLISSYNENEIITHEQLKQLLDLLNNGSIPVKEAVAIVIQRISCHETNAENLIERNFVYHLVKLLERPKQHYKPILLALQKLLDHQNLCSDIWMEYMVVKGLPLIANILSHSNIKSVQVAALCVMRSLAANGKLCILIVDQCMQPIMDNAYLSKEHKKVTCSIMANLAAHNDHIISNILDWNTLPLISTVLKDGTCGAQIYGMTFLANLSECDYGLSVILEEQLVQYVIYSIANSSCREIRETACRIIKNMLVCRKTPQLRDFILQIANLNSQKDTTEADMDMTTLDTEALLKLGIGRKEVSAKVEKGVKKLTCILITLLLREAKIDVNAETKKVQNIGFRPSRDRYQTLKYIISCLTAIIALPLNKPRYYDGAGDAETRPNCQHQKTNPNMVKILVENGALYVLDVLFVYSCKLIGNNSGMMSSENNSGMMSSENNSIDVLHLHALMNMWDKPDTVTFRFDPKELYFVHHMLTFISIFVSFCSRLVYADLEQKILQDLKEEQQECNKDDDVDEKSTPINDNPDKKVTWCDSIPSILHVPSHPTSSSVLLATPRQPSRQGRRTKLKERIRPSSGYRFHRRGCNPAENSDKLFFERLEREMSDLKKHMKLLMLKEGVIQSVGPWLQSDFIEIKVTVLDILQCMIQPLIGTDYGMKSVTPFSKRPTSAKTITERDEAIQRALGHMTDSSAMIINDALNKAKRPRPASAPSKNTKGKLQERHAPHRLLSWKPTIDYSHPLSWQCCLSIFDVCGMSNMSGLSSSNHQVKLKSLMIIHNAAAFGETTIHMKLSSLGCIPKLIEFLRLNDGEDLMQILALMTIRTLVTEDTRLKQLFVKHGGADLLMAMSNWTSGMVKKEVTQTLTSITR
ncbi:LOW QUALITY PROTEIN: uncharacterized protein LOC102801813, partial [Saccoglossus kowalevskii]